MANITEISAGESAYREIRNRIVSLDLKPNQTIGETYLADELGMSRTPIREALTRLSSEGLIDFRSRAGTIVSPIRFDAVISAQYVREKSKRAVFNIRQAIDEQQFAILEGDTAGFFVADERMHRHFSEMTDRVAVWSVISEAKKHMDRVRRLSLQKIDLNVLLSDHLLILEAIENHDVDAARSIVTTHLRRVMHDLDNLAEQHSDYFELAKSEK